MEGAQDWSPTLYFKLMKEFGMKPDTAKYLSNTYGSKAIDVAKLAKETKSNFFNLRYKLKNIVNKLINYLVNKV